jgi:gliding motility-associated-like protein
LILPTRALGNEYYAMSYEQMPSSTEYRVSEFTVVAVEDNTTLEITLPTGVSSTTHAASTTYQTAVLNKGDVYQFQSTKDVTGVKIKTVGNCTPIAVFSGSTKTGFCTTPGVFKSGNADYSGDNLYQQLFPISSWGKNFVTAPFYNALHGVTDIFRIYVATDNTQIAITGATNSIIGTPLNGTYAKGSIITFTSSVPNIISASKSISVAQIQVTQSCNAGNNTAINYPGDPELTILNPIEQTLTDITLYSAISVPAAPTQITNHYINVILKTADIPVFTFDNATLPASQFVAINGQYSYLIKDVTASSSTTPTHRIKSPNGFLAIAYGYGNVESYAYLAGADIKNLTEFVSIKPASGQSILSNTCAGKSLQPEVTLPFQTNTIIWDFDNGQAPITQTTTAPDSTILQADGTTLYVYKYGSVITYSGAGVKNINVKPFNPISSLCGGYDELKLSFEIFPLPTATFTASAQVCVNGVVTFTDQSTISSGTIKKWMWDFKDGSVLERTSGAAFTHTYTQAGDYAPVVTLLTDNGCSITSPAKAVHISPLPVALFSSNTPLCEKRSVQFTDQSTTAEGTIVAWNWNFGDGQTAITQHPQHTYTSAGSYTVSLTIRSSLGCEQTLASTVLVVNALPQVDFLVPSICLSDVTASFPNQSTNADGSTTNLTYAWNFGDAVKSTPSNPNTATSRNPTHNYSDPGDYSISLGVTTAQGCSVTQTKTFRVNGINPVADFEVVNSSNLCSKNSVSFINRSYVAGFGSVTRLEWYFDYGNNPTQVLVDNNPSSDKVYTFSYPTFHTPAPKNYSVRLVAYSGGVCVSLETIKTIVLKAVPEVAFSTLSSVCQEITPFQITQATELYNFSGTFRFSGTGVTSSGRFSPLIAGVGTHQLKYVFTAQNGCADSASRSITVFATPTVNAGRDTIILAGGTVQLQAQAAGTGLIYQWTPISYLSNPQIANPVASPNDDILYTLTVSSNQGCLAADNIFIKVLQLPEIPNAFTPNADGYNDVWNIRYLESYANATVEIFNRYGQQVFYSVGYARPWDGRFKNEDLPMGTYYYIINPGNGRKAMTGSVTLIK